MSRSEYIALASRTKSVGRKWVHMKSKQTTPTGVAISFANIANPALTQRIRNDNVQGEVMNSRPLEKKKSYGRRNNGKSSFDDYTRKKSFTYRKIGISLRMIAEWLPPNSLYPLILRSVSRSESYFVEDVLPREI